MITVADKLDARGELEAAGGLGYLTELAQNTPSASNIRAYAQVVSERASLRRLIEAAQDIAESGFAPDGRTSDELIDEAERLIERAAEMGQGLIEGLRARLGDLLGSVRDGIGRAGRFRRQHPPTGRSDEDRVCGSAPPHR